MSYISGEDRDQGLLLPMHLDEFVDADNSVRFLDAFVNGLDLGKLGFRRAKPKHKGRPAYDPRDLLKLYIYGYLYRIRSSRRLEAECHRNVELMWLLRRLTPDFKTIADFRKDNLATFKKVFREFNGICTKLDLFGRELVAIDGTKLKAVNSRLRNFTDAKLDGLFAKLDKRIDDYLEKLETADREEDEHGRVTDLKSKIAAIEEERQAYYEMQRGMEKDGVKQVSLTDPDSRAMPKTNPKDVSYNAQLAVDSKHNLIVSQEVTNDVNDLGQLSNLAIAAQDALEVDELTVVADKGYASLSEIRECSEHGITPYVSEPSPKNRTEMDHFPKSKFRYDQQTDTYACPAGHRLHPQSTDETGTYYQTSDCDSCPLKADCTTSDRRRRIRRGRDEHLMEQMRSRIRENPGIVRKRKGIVEPVFGCIKSCQDNAYFLLKRLPGVNAEFSLASLAYNIKRAINVVGIHNLIAAVG